MACARSTSAAKSGAGFHHLVQPARALLDHVVLAQDRGDLFELRARRWGDEQRRERRVVAMELLLELRGVALFAQLRKEHALLDGDVPQQTAAEFVVRVVWNLRRAEAAGEKRVEARVIAGQKVVQRVHLRHRRNTVTPYGRPRR